VRVYLSAVFAVVSAANFAFVFAIVADFADFAVQQ
jgi:hypothetical protein